MAKEPSTTSESDEESPFSPGMLEREMSGDLFNESDLDDWDSTMYDGTGMTSWGVFLLLRGCAFDNISIWRSIGVALLVAVVSAALSFFVPDAKLYVLDPEQMAKFGAFLTKFSGMLLGFFISSSMNRWYTCVAEFMALLEAVRLMQMEMSALGVPKERLETISRFGILSVWLLHLRLGLDSDDHPELERISGKATSKDLEALKRKRLWKQVEALRPGLVKPEEKELLYPHGECYGLVWTFIASLLGRMAQDGEIPPLASPTFLRILGVVEQAYNSIREVRALQKVKPPFIYVHTLAFLVHMNSMIVSCCCGLSFGFSMNHMMSERHDAASQIGAIASWSFHYCYCMLPTLLYLAILEVSVCVSQPFEHHDARIPAKRFIKNMERDLQSAMVIADNPPYWDKPSFHKVQ